MATPFSFEGNLTSPEGDDLVGEPIPFLASGQYDSQAEYVLDLPNAVATLSIDFGTIPAAGAKMVAIKYDARTGAAPVQFTFNGGADLLEVSTGGFVVYFSPTPVAGITGLSLSHTTSGKIRIWILG